ncbi:MAG: hypothetical protein J0I13_14350, partial [Rhizobiales bacterium]|nr:hypothetical protein [Hyphomicrobiales bacterium]
LSTFQGCVVRMIFEFANLDPAWCTACVMLALGAAFGAMPVQGALLAWIPACCSARPARAAHRSSAIVPPVVAAPADAASVCAARPPTAVPVVALPMTTAPVAARLAPASVMRQTSARIIPFPLARRVAGAYAIATAGGASPGPSFS